MVGWPDHLDSPSIIITQTTAVLFRSDAVVELHLDHDPSALEARHRMRGGSRLVGLHEMSKYIDPYSIGSYRSL